MTVYIFKLHKKTSLLAAKMSCQEQTITLEAFKSLCQANNSFLQEAQYNTEMLSKH